MTIVQPHFLVETDWLAHHLTDDTLRIFDVTGRLSSTFQNRAKGKVYDIGHIPGAVYLDVPSPLGPFSKQGAQQPWTWPELDQFEALMGQIGVSNHSQVILYAASPREGVDFGLMWCTRAWWIMHHFGVTCAILDGGWEKWVAEGRPVSNTPASYPETTFKADPDWRRGLATKENVLTLVERSEGACLIDALSAESYAGTDKTVYGPRKGHITGALSIPMDTLIDPEFYTFKSAEALRTRFETMGIDSSQKIIAYCGGGIASTVDAFALKLLGYENVSVYDGSLFEWSANPNLPMTDPSEAK